MLTPEQIAALGDAAANIAVPITEYLIKDIARRVSEAGQLTSTAAYQIWRAQNLGISQKKIREMLRRELKVSHKELRSLLRQSAEVGYNFDIRHLSRAAVPFAENAVMQQMVSAAVKLAKKDFINLTQTLGMVAPNGKAYPLTKVYQKTCDFAFEQVFTGAADYNTAIRQATKNIADYGVRAIDYETGTSTSLEAAVRRNVLGGMGLMQQQISQHNHDELGATGWEISAHAGSAPDHEPYQGKQYTDAEYTALNSSLARPIGTLNCGHAAFPIILGVNEPQYSKAELAQMQQQNKEGITYQGKQYTMYEATQKQRQIERVMRKQKNRILISEATGDKDRLQISQIRLGRLREEYTRFSKAAGLPMQQERIRVAGFGKGQAARAKAGAESYYQYWSKSIGANDSVKTLADYYEMKYNNPPEYALLKQYAKDVESGWISPLCGFENYKSLHTRIQNEIVGKATSSGTLINGQNPHFMQRVIGTMIDPKILKKDLVIIRRSGVDVDDIKSALFTPLAVGEKIIKENGKPSISFIGKRCRVAMNPDTGELIQVNPRKER